VAVLAVADSRIVQSVLSGEDGRFALAGLPAAKYQLTASKRGYRTAFYDQHEEYNSAIVTGEAQETEQLVFRLAPQAILHGLVTADGGEAVEAAKVLLFRKPRGQNPGDRIVQVDSATTDDTGAYEFANLAAGEYLLAVRAEPWYTFHRSFHAADGGMAVNSANTLDLSYPITYFDSTTDEASASSITLAAGSRAEANFSLHAEPTPHLTVLISGTRHEAFPGLQLSIFGTLSLPSPTQIVEDGQSTRVDFTGLAPGRYELQHGEPPRLLDLDLTSSQQIDSSAGAPTTSVSGTLHATSNSDSNSGAAMTDEIRLLTLTRLGGSGNRQSMETIVHKGQFNFAAVPPGDWALSTASFGKEWQTFSISADGKTHSGNQITVRDRALSLAVTVSESVTRIEGIARKNDKGIGGVLIVLVPQDPGANLALFRRDQSDTDGSFALLDAIPGQYTIVAIENGWDLDWARPEVIGRYLTKGIAVSIDASSGKLLRLSQPVPVQLR
jgi:hypothetical protein